MADRYRLLEETCEHFGVTLRRIYWIDEHRAGGWLGPDAILPQNTKANVYGQALILGGTIEGGIILGGTIRGGTIRGGIIEGGTIWGGTIRGGTIEGGTIWGGTFSKSPSCAQRSDGYMFVAKIVDGDLRIWAGCRNFSWDQAVEHWNDEHLHGAESQRIIYFLKEQAEAEAETCSSASGETGETDV